MRLKEGVNAVFARAEARGRFRRLPAFDTDYHRDYPELALLEREYPAIRDEALGLLEIKDRITDLSALVGTYTAGGIHTVQWKSFVLKSRYFVPENCARAPVTTALLRQIPYAETAFFSILDPHQHIKPHWGYWKGFVRYHLGLLVPNDNANGECWLRVNARPEDNARGDRDLIENGDKYYWRNGRGVIFDDTFLHDAENRSGQIRVVLFLDLRRRMPWYLSALNRTSLLLAQLDPQVRGIRRNAVVP